MSQDHPNYQAPYLPDDIARCPGVGFDEDGTGEIDWREGCDVCWRRLAPTRGEYTPQMEPPVIITFECPWLIEGIGRDA